MGQTHETAEPGGRHCRHHGRVGTDPPGPGIRPTRGDAARYRSLRGTAAGHCWGIVRFIVTACGRACGINQPADLRGAATVGRSGVPGMGGDGHMARPLFRAHAVSYGRVPHGHSCQPDLERCRSGIRECGCRHHYRFTDPCPTGLRYRRRRKLAIHSLAGMATRPLAAGRNRRVRPRWRGSVAATRKIDRAPACGDGRYTDWHRRQLSAGIWRAWRLGHRSGRKRTSPAFIASDTLR